MEKYHKLICPKCHMIRYFISLERMEETQDKGFECTSCVIARQRTSSLGILSRIQPKEKLIEDSDSIESLEDLVNAD